jgi:hypothetical protein
MALCAAPGPASAQVLANYDYENLTFRGIGLDWGRIWPDEVNETTVWSLRVDLGYLGPAVRIVPTLSYWKSDLKAQQLSRLAARLSNLPALQQQAVVLTAGDLGDVDWSTLTLSLDAHAVWTAPGRIFTFVGMGLGLHAMNGSGASINDTFVEDLLDTMAPGLAFMAGLEFEPAPMLRIYTEGRYTLQSEVKYPGLRIGAALMVPSNTARTQ